MKNITKGTEPHSLTSWRATDPENYADYPDKDGLREHLAGEQCNICCYCMRRIYPQTGSMKVEHWQSQSTHRHLRLVYSNLLGVCMGGDGCRDADKHCDTFKGNRSLSRNPANPVHNVEGLIRYLPDGTIQASETVFSGQLASVLNLNLPFLRNNRKAVLESLQKMLAKRGGSLTRIAWENLIADWNGASGAIDLQPYCGVVIYWARKHLARL